MDALSLSIAALIVSLGAAGFTAWQAVTAHLERTRPKPASLSLLQSDRHWVVENGGGSTASHVAFTFTYELPARRGEKVVAKVDGDVPPGQRRRINDSREPGRHFIVEGEHIRLENGGLRRAEAGQPGIRILAKRVRVDWTDYRGKRLKSTVLLP